MIALDLLLVVGYAWVFAGVAYLAISIARPRERRPLEFGDPELGSVEQQRKHGQVEERGGG